MCNTKFCVFVCVCGGGGGVLVWGQTDDCTTIVQPSIGTRLMIVLSTDDCTMIVQPSIGSPDKGVGGVPSNSVS